MYNILFEIGFPDSYQYPGRKSKEPDCLQILQFDDGTFGISTEQPLSDGVHIGPISIAELKAVADGIYEAIRKVS